MNSTANYAYIEKESITQLHFPNQEVLPSTDAIKERQIDLARALTLGNLEYTKIKIYFEDDQSVKIVDTTVWGLTDKRVILKQGIVIPINRVLKVKF